MPAPTWDEFVAFARSRGAEVEGGAEEWSAFCGGYDQEMLEAGYTPDDMTREWMSFFDDEVLEIVDSYPWIGIRGDDLVGLPTRGGEPWTTAGDPRFEGHEKGGRWFTTLPDGTVEYHDEWLARQPLEER